MRDYKLYVTDIIDSIDKIELYVCDLDFHLFNEDIKTYDAVLQNLLIIGEAANKIPESVQNNYPDIDWRGIIGMRNIIVHGYFKINPEIIWQTIQKRLPELLDRIKRVE